MAIYERSRADADDNGFEKLDVHGFCAALRELSRGAVTKAQVVTAFNLSAEDETELDAIISKYNGLSTNLEKKDFIVKFEDVLILVEKFLYDKAKAKAELGF